MTLLKIKGLKTYYYLPNGIIKAVDNVNLELKRGGVLGLVGESGSGKSTLAQSIMRLIHYPGKIVQGEIFFDGEDILKKSEKSMESIRGNKISIIFQGAMNALNPVHRIGDQISESILLHKDITKNDAKKRSKN